MFLDELGSSNILKSMSREQTVVQCKEPWGWRAAWEGTEKRTMLSVEVGGVGRKGGAQEVVW